MQFQCVTGVFPTISDDGPPPEKQSPGTVAAVSGAKARKTVAGLNPSYRSRADFATYQVDGNLRVEVLA
jgi:hypothetical protein